MFQQLSDEVDGMFKLSESNNHSSKADQAAIAIA